MKAHINAKTLREATALVSMAMSPKTFNNAYDDILLTTPHHEAITLTAGDSEQSMIVTMPATIEALGTLCVNGQRWTALANLPNTSDLQLQLLEATLQVRNDQSHFTLATSDPTKYPSNPTPHNNIATVALAGTFLASAMKFVTRFDEFKTGVILHIAPGQGITLVVANQHHVAMCEVAGDVQAHPPTANQVYLPVNAASVITQMALAAGSGTVQLAISHTACQAITSQGRYESTLLAAAILPWQTLKEKNSNPEHTATISPTSLTNAVRSAMAVISGGDSNILNIHIRPAEQLLTISASTEQGQAQSTCPIKDATGDEYTVRVNGRYLLLHLQAMQAWGDAVTMASNANHVAIQFFPTQPGIRSLFAAAE